MLDMLDRYTLPGPGLRAGSHGTLVGVLVAYNQERTPLNILWPSSRQLSPKLRVFVDFVAENLSLP